ncbi:MAG: actin interacting [Trebouxia sp. A1-2]|nr:MAG: actin interacting [Trebouxia sp. A1-2]
MLAIRQWRRSACLQTILKNFARGAQTAAAISRNKDYAEIHDRDVAYFRDILGDRGVITDPDALQPVNRDWMGKYEGKSQLALKPQTTEQVSQILKYCNERQLAVGGNTGLVGGSVPLFDEVVLATAAMNKILGVLSCQSGCVLEQLDNHVGQQGHTMPPGPGCQGQLSDWGQCGLRYLRYGSMHGNVTGLEVVLAGGTVLDLMSTLRKDNTGYDMKQMFIGGEGTLGIITKVAIQCPAKPSSVQVTYLAVPTFQHAQKVFQKAKQHLGEILSAFEFLDHHSLIITLKNLSFIKNPLPDTQTPIYLVVETSGSNAEHDYAKLEKFLEEAYEEEIIYDLSLPPNDMYKLVEETRARMKHLPVTVVGYGHMGDSNLHLNISAAKYDKEILAHIEPFVYEWTADKKGSISAEHGLGQMKPECIGYSKSAEAVQLMGRFKSLLDPNQILNPYKLLPEKNRYYKPHKDEHATAVTH